MPRMVVQYLMYNTVHVPVLSFATKLAHGVLIDRIGSIICRGFCLLLLAAECRT